MNDIVIVGGGIVGTTLALYLAKQTQLSITLLEANPFNNTWSTDHYHHRVSAISVKTKAFFQSIDIWDELKQHRISPFTRMKIWDEEEQAIIEFDSDELKIKHLGYIIENNLIQKLLMEQIKKYPSIQIISPIELIVLIQEKDHIILKSNQNIDITTSLLIAADGSYSWVRQKLGIPVFKKPYDQEAIVATVQTEYAHDQTAKQLFGTNEILAFLPLHDPN